VGPKLTLEARYFLASVTLDGLIPDASRLSEAAMSLLHRVNGVARVLNFDSRPVCLSGRFADDSGGRLTVVPLGTVEERERALPVTALVGGQPQSAHSPPAPGYVQLAETDPHVADVLEILGKADPAPDWVGLFKVLEIVRDSAGRLTRLKTMGWIPSAKLEAFSASANHPAISGDQARHARMPGTPPITRVMTLAQARETIGNLVAHWIDALSMDTSSSHELSASPGLPAEDHFSHT
jgi:hypothetical protein